MILSLLLEGEQSVGAIEAATGVGQPALSQQLAELRHAGLLASRRAARQVYYRLADPTVEARARALQTLFIDESPVIKPAGRTAAQAGKTRGRPERKEPAGAATFAQILR
jgi:DNA-binding transcriptional ArsR family regulator